MIPCPFLKPSQNVWVGTEPNHRHRQRFLVRQAFANIWPRLTGRSTFARDPVQSYVKEILGIGMFARSADLHFRSPPEPPGWSLCLWLSQFQRVAPRPEVTVIQAVSWQKYGYLPGHFGG